MENSLVTSLVKSIGTEASGIAGEFLEIGIDSLCNDGLLRDIPFVSTVASVFHIGQTVRDRHSILKLAAFIEEINHTIINETELEKYKTKFETDEKTRDNELSHLLILIDRYIGIDRPRMLAKLYLAYLRKDLQWTELVSYAEVIDRLLPNDCKLLANSDVKGVDYQEVDSGYLRLSALGLMVDYGKNTAFNLGSFSVVGGNRKNYALTEFGAKLSRILELSKTDTVCASGE